MSGVGWLSLYYGYIDESGDVVPFYGSRFLVVTALLTANPRPIELHIKRARASLGRKAGLDELHASTTAIHVTERLLKALTDEEIEVLAVILDKQMIVRPPADAEELYRHVVTRLVKQGVERHPRIELWLDKRYTKPGLRDRLERTIRDGIANLSRQAVQIHQADAHSQRGLQAADHIAWALHRKYEREDETLYQILASKIVVEETLIQELW